MPVWMPDWIMGKGVDVAIAGLSAAILVVVMAIWGMCRLLLARHEASARHRRMASNWRRGPR